VGREGPVDVSRRLDRLPLGRFHRRLVVSSGLGWAFDAMDVGLLSFAIVAIGREWGLTANERGLVAAIGFAGMFIGALLSGIFADRFGRKPIFQLTLLVYSLATGLSGLAWGLASLLVFRFLVGLGVGGELPVASTLVSEMSPARHRGRLIVILESFWAYGWILAAVVGFFVVPRSADGWRWAFFLGALPALYVFVLRRAVPESPRWLASVGRRDEAAATLAAIERESGVAPEPLTDTPDQPPARAATAPFAERFAALWSSAYRRRTIMLWILWFGIVYSYYGVFTWLPSLLTARGFNLNAAFGNVLIITLAQVPGYFSAAWLVERWGRKPTLIAYLLGSALAAWLLGNADRGAVLDTTRSIVSALGLDPDARTVAVLFSGSLLSFFNLGAWGVVYTYTPEQYPTAVRGTGAGSAAAFGRLGAIIGPYLVPWLLGNPADGSGLGLPQSAIFAMFMIVFLVVAVAVALLGEETKGKALEQLATDAPDGPRAALSRPATASSD
jgi:MFS transporter, putative metabolite:H+ symporter